MDYRGVMEMQPAYACSLCGRPAGQRCTGCRTAMYCSRECQVEDWPRHSDVCGMGSTMSAYDSYNPGMYSYMAPMGGPYGQPVLPVQHYTYSHAMQPQAAPHSNGGSQPIPQQPTVHAKRARPAAAPSRSVSPVKEREATNLNTGINAGAAAGAEKPSKRARVGKPAPAPEPAPVFAPEPVPEEPAATSAASRLAAFATGDVEEDKEDGGDRLGRSNINRQRKASGRSNPDYAVIKAMVRQRQEEMKRSGRRQRAAYSALEDLILIEGLETHGPGSYEATQFYGWSYLNSEHREVGFSLQARSTGDLKDRWRTIKTQFGRNALPAHLTPIQDRISKLVDADEGREKIRGAPRHKTQQMKDAEASLDVSVHDAAADVPLDIPPEQVAQVDKLDKEILTIEEKIDKCVEERKALVKDTETVPEDGSTLDKRISSVNARIEAMRAHKMELQKQRNQVMVPIVAEHFNAESSDAIFLTNSVAIADAFAQSKRISIGGHAEADASLGGAVPGHEVKLIQLRFIRWEDRLSKTRRTEVTNPIVRSRLLKPLLEEFIPRLVGPYLDSVDLRYTTADRKTRDVPYFSVTDLDTVLDLNAYVQPNGQIIIYVEAPGVPLNIVPPPPRVRDRTRAH